MSDERSTSPRERSAAVMALRLGFAFLVLLAIEGCFWFTADFRTFTPRCDGPFWERAFFSAWSACGPLTWTVNFPDGGIAWSSDAGAGALFALALIAAGLVAIVGRA